MVCWWMWCLYVYIYIRTHPSSISRYLIWKQAKRYYNFQYARYFLSNQLTISLTKLLQMFKNGGLVLAFIALTVLATVVIPSTNAEFGCHKEYCWSWCNRPGAGDWCYTTKGPENDENRVGCTTRADCRENWQCANECQPKNYTK